MLGRRPGFANGKLTIFVAVFVGAAALLYVYNLSTKLKRAEQQRDRYKAHQESLSAQLQVVYERKGVLEKDIQKQKNSYDEQIKEMARETEVLKRKNEEDMQKLSEKLDDEKQQEKILQSKQEDISLQLERMLADKTRVAAELQETKERDQKEYEAMKQTKDDIISKLKDEVSDLRAKLRTAEEQQETAAREVRKVQDRAVLQAQQAEERRLQRMQRMDEEDQKRRQELEKETARMRRRDERSKVEFRRKTEGEETGNRNTEQKPQGKTENHHGVNLHQHGQNEDFDKEQKETERQNDNRGAQPFLNQNNEAVNVHQQSNHEPKLQPGHKEHTDAALKPEDGKRVGAHPALQEGGMVPMGRLGVRQGNPVNELQNNEMDGAVDGKIEENNQVQAPGRAAQPLDEAAGKAEGENNQVQAPGRADNDGVDAGNDAGNQMLPPNVGQQGHEVDGGNEPVGQQGQQVGAPRQVEAENGLVENQALPQGQQVQVPDVLHQDDTEDAGFPDDKDENNAKEIDDEEEERRDDVPEESDVAQEGGEKRQAAAFGDSLV